MAADNIFSKDDTSQIITVPLRSSTTGSLLSGVLYSGVTIKYHRQGASPTTVTPVTMSAGTWTSSGWIETSDSGMYQFGIPNAALASGANEVLFTFRASGAVDCVRKYILLDANLRAASGYAYGRLLNVNVVRSATVPLFGTGTVASGATSTSIPTSAFTFPTGVSGQLVGKIITFSTATLTAGLCGTSCIVTAVTVSATPTFTVQMADGSPLPAVPASGDTFVIS